MSAGRDDHEDGGELPALWRQLARTLIGEPTLTRHEVAQQAGVDVALARRLWAALGFPPIADDQRLFTRADVDTLRAATAMVTRRIVDADALVQMTRVTGQALARVAAAQVTIAEDGLTAALQAAAAGDPAALTGAMGLLPGLDPFFGYVWRRHLLATLWRLATTATGATTDGGAAAVGFADLVGFTATSAQLTGGELAAMVDRFEALVYEQVTAHGGRVVKMIGDEAMVVADEPQAAVAIALGLVEACELDPEIPSLRIGLAYGPVVAWEGDLFGPTVNLASRLGNVARAGGVLVSPAFAERLAESPAFSLHPLRAYDLKGIGRVRPVLVRRATPAAAAPTPRRGRPQRRRPPP